MKPEIKTKLACVAAIVSIIAAIAEHTVRKDIERYLEINDGLVKQQIIEIEQARGKIVDLEYELEDTKNYYIKRKAKAH